MGKEGSVLLEFDYGTEMAVDRDVDAFERFYRTRFEAKALASFVDRTRRRSRICGMLLCFVMALLFIPVLVNASSIFAYILLCMGLGLGGVGVFLLTRSARSEAYCRKNLDRLLENEFAATRSITQRCFHVSCTEEGVEVRFGSRSSVKQKRFRSYEDIERAYVTDELLFIPGLTWLCRFQLSDDQFRELCALLQRYTFLEYEKDDGCGPPL